MKTRRSRGTGRDEQRGIALLSAIFALLLVSAIAFGMMYMANTETAINYNYRDQQKAAYAAYAGLQEVRDRLTSGAASPVAVPTAMPTTTPGGIVYLLNPRGSETIDPTTGTYKDTELCHEGFGGLSLTDTGQNVPCASTIASSALNTATKPASTSADTGTNAAIPYKWVRITWKNNIAAGGDTTGGSTYPNAFKVTGSGSTATTTQICWDGAHEIPLPTDGRANCDADPVGGTNYTRSVYLLTSLAVTPAGARKMVQAEVALTPPFVTNSAIDTNDFVNTSGSSVTINGFDNCNCHCTTAVGGAAPTCTNRSSGAACTGSTYAIFTSETVSSSGNPAIIAGTSPATAQNQVFPYDVNNLINTYKTASGAVNVTGAPYNFSCSGGSCGTISGGSYGTPPTNFPTDCTTTTTSNCYNVSNPAGLGKQITYFPGSVDLQAHAAGAGILIIDGDLTIHGGIDFYGLILVKGVVTFQGSGSGQGVNVIGGVLSGQGSVADQYGGGVNVQFDRCAQLQNTIAAPPKSLAMRELSY